MSQQYEIFLSDYFSTANECANSALPWRTPRKSTTNSSSMRTNPDRCGTDAHNHALAALGRELHIAPRYLVWLHYSNYAVSVARSEFDAAAQPRQASIPPCAALLEDAKGKLLAGSNAYYIVRTHDSNRGMSIS
jgi:hypothetical protein